MPGDCSHASLAAVCAWPGPSKATGAGSRRLRTACGAGGSAPALLRGESEKSMSPSFSARMNARKTAFQTKKRARAPSKFPFLLKLGRGRGRSDGSSSVLLASYSSLRATNHAPYPHDEDSNDYGHRPVLRGGRERRGRRAYLHLRQGSEGATPLPSRNRPLWCGTHMTTHAGRCAWPCSWREHVPHSCADAAAGSHCTCLPARRTGPVVDQGLRPPRLRVVRQRVLHDRQRGPRQHHARLRIGACRRPHLPTRAALALLPAPSAGPSPSHQRPHWWDG